MSFKGSLEDLCLVDVLQLLYVARKTGILHIDGPEGKASLALREGFIVGASHPSEDRKIGNVSVEMDLVPAEDLQAALEIQRAAGVARLPLIGTLVAMGKLASEDCWKPLERLIEDTMVEVVAMTSGQFAFEPSEEVPRDPFRHLPEAVAPDVNLDTQQALLDALRIVDERHRYGPSVPAPSPLPPPTPPPSSDNPSVPAPARASSSPPPSAAWTSSTPPATPVPSPSIPASFVPAPPGAPAATSGPPTRAPRVTSSAPPAPPPASVPTVPSASASAAPVLETPIPPPPSSASIPTSIPPAPDPPSEPVPRPPAGKLVARPSSTAHPASGRVTLPSISAPTAPQGGAAVWTASVPPATERFPSDTPIDVHESLLHVAAHPSDPVESGALDDVRDSVLPVAAALIPDGSSREWSDSVLPLAAPPSVRTDLQTHPVALFTSDGLLKLSAGPVCRKAGFDLFVSETERDVLQRVDHWLTDAQIPVVVVDAGVADEGPHASRKRHALVHRLHELEPELPVVVLSGGDRTTWRRLPSLGVTSVLPRPTQNGSRSVYVTQVKDFLNDLTEYLHGLFGLRLRSLQVSATTRHRLSVLRDRVRDIRFSGASSEISLTVLRYVADFLERCVIFLVRRDDLLGLGAFGVSSGEEALSTAVARLRIPLPPDSTLAEIVARGTIFRGRPHDELLKRHLYSKIGAPATPEILLLPLRTEERTAALIYGDFGEHDSRADQLDPLEILAEFAGMAFDLALQRKREQTRSSTPAPGAGNPFTD